VLAAAIGTLGTLAALLGRTQIDLLAFGAPAVALAVLMIGLMALYLEKWSDRFVRLVLILGALALVALGILSMGRANLDRIILGCFTPAVLFTAAAIDLVLSRSKVRS
jgi:hypothetical protein